MKGQARFVGVIMSLIIAGILIIFFPLISSTTFYMMNGTVNETEAYVIGALIPYFWILIALAIFFISFRGSGAQE